MKHKLRIAGIVLGVFVVALVALPFGLNANSFRPKLESELSAALGRTVTVGNLSLSIFSGSVSAHDLSIADDPSFTSNSFIRAKSLKVGVEILPLIFSKTLHVTELTLEHPEITLIRSASGAWNFSGLGAGNSAPSAASVGTPNPVAGMSNPTPASTQSATGGLAVKALDVKDGRVTVEHADTGQTRIYDNVNITVRNFSFGAPFPFTLTAVLPNNGTLKLEGNAGPINSTDTSLTPLQAQIKVNGLDLAASGIGELSPGIAGMANYDGTVGSDGLELRTAGTLQADRLQLVKSGSPAGRPVQLKYAIAHQLHSQTGTISESDISMGAAVAHLTGNYQIQGQTATVDMKLNAQNMPVDDLEAMLPALGVVLPSGSRLNGGTLSANLTITGPASSPVIAGPIRLSNSKLVGFDLGSKLSSVSKLGGAKTGADTSIQNLSTDARISPDGVRTDKVNLTIPALGTLTGNGTISPGGALNYRMTANLNGAVATAVTSMVGLGSQGESVPFFINGSTSNPSFSADVKGMLTGQIGSQIGSAIKSKLFGKSTPKNAPASSPQKSSVINKLTGWFHKKKNNNGGKQ
jgi:AsmA protein